MNSFARRVLIFALVMAGVAGAAWVGRKAYRKHSEHRLVAQAAQCIQKKDMRNAGLCLRRALQINPASAKASGMMADLLEGVGSPAALGWRMRTAQLEPNDPEHRLAWASTALKLQDAKSAADALAGVDQNTKNGAVFHKLSGALAWSQHNAAEAEKQYDEALRLEPANAVIQINLATVHMSSTNREVADVGRALLRTMSSAANTNAPLRLVALTHLIEDAQARKQWPEAVSYSDEMLRMPSATFRDKLLHLKLLYLAKDPKFAGCFTDLREEAVKSPAEAFGFGQWLVASEGPTNALRWLQSLPVTVRTNQPVPLILTDCQIALADWKGILDTLGKQDWGDGQFYRFALESLAQRSLGQTLASSSAWQKSLKLASHRLDRLSRLAQVTAAWRWEPEMTAVLVEATTQFPKEKWASDALTAAYYRSGNTRAIGELLARAYAANPTDSRLKNNLANVYLLRKFELDKAYRLAKEAYNSATNNPFFTCTFAYSLLMQNQKEEALKVMEGVKPEYLKIPSIAAYYGVVHAQTGHGDLAKEPLQRAEAASLLPEEKEIVRLAKAKL